MDGNRVGPTKLLAEHSIFGADIVVTDIVVSFEEFEEINEIIKRFKSELPNLKDVLFV